MSPVLFFGWDFAHTDLAALQQHEDLAALENNSSPVLDTPLVRSEELVCWVLRFESAAETLTLYEPTKTTAAIQAVKN